MWIGIEWALISLSLALWEIDLNMWNYLDKRIFLKLINIVLEIFNQVAAIDLLILSVSTDPSNTAVRPSPSAGNLTALCVQRGQAECAGKCCSIPVQSWI